MPFETLIWVGQRSLASEGHAGWTTCPWTTLKFIQKVYLALLLLQPMQPFFEHPPTVEPFLEHKQVEDVDPDFAELQHAFFLQQQQQQQQLQHQQQLPFMNRGRGGFRGRGFGRGRGRGRGYAKFQAETNTFPPPLQQQSALIVIQVSCFCRSIQCY